MATAMGIPILTLNYFYVRTDYFKKENGVSAFASVPSGLVVANTGSSHGKYGLSYENLPGVVGFNFAMEGQPFVYDLAMLRRYAPSMASNAVVLFTVSIESFHRYPEETPQIRPRYYRLLPKCLLPDYRLAEDIRFDLLPVLGAGRNVGRIIQDQATTDEVFRQTNMGNCSRDELDRQAQARFKDTSFVVIRPAGKSVLKKNEELLAEMIAFCRERGWVPVLVSLPFVREYAEQFSKAFWAEFDGRLATVRQAAGNPPLLDYSRDGRFADSPDLFADVDHLNVRGAEQLTAVVVGELRQNGWLPCTFYSFGLMKP